MKTIIYSIIAVLIFGTIAAGYINMANTTNTILIQSADNNISPVSLTRSVKIISARLKDFSSGKFEVTFIPKKNQIQVTLEGNWDLKTVENLLTQKGVIAFYETYNRAGLTELLPADNQLFSFFNDSISKYSDAKIGCTEVTNVENVNAYIGSLGLSQKCKFAWGEYADNTSSCLYALKLDTAKGALLTDADIESMKYKQDKALNIFYVEIRFKKSAVELWANVTKRNINSAIAVVLDNKVLYAPVVHSEINNGTSQITGSYSETEVKYFAALGNNGELPVSFRIVK